MQRIRFRIFNVCTLVFTFSQTLPFVSMRAFGEGTSKSDSSPQNVVLEGSGPECKVRGSAVVEKGVTIFSTREAGTAIAAFATQEVTLELSEFSAQSTKRAKIRTGKGKGSLRIEGWVDPTKIGLSAKQEIPVVEGHVSIGKGEIVKLQGASLNKLHVESTIVATEQKLSAKTPCDRIAVGRVAPVAEEDIPASARRYVLKNTSLDLLKEPGGSVVFTLQVLAPKTGILLFSKESKGAYTHVLHTGPYVIDAWAKASELERFPQGEMLDTLVRTDLVSISPAKLKVEGNTKEVKTTKEIPVRLSANESIAPIGFFEEDAELIVVDTIGSWSRVFPKGLEIIPPDGKDFWVQASDIGLIVK